MPSKRSSSSRRPVAFPVSDFDPEIVDPLFADNVSSLQPVQHGPDSTTPPSAQPLSPPLGPRRASYPRDRRKTVDLRGGFDPHIVNASAADTAQSFELAQRRPVSIQPPSAPLRPRSVSRKRRRDHAANVQGRGRFDSHVEISLEAIMAPPYQPAQSEDKPQTPPPRRHVERTSKRDSHTTIEDVYEDHLTNATHERVADGFEVPRQLPLGVEESSRFAGHNTPQKRIAKENPVATPYSKKAASQVGARVPQDAKHKYNRYAEEAGKYIIGPMPVIEFLNFLPDAGPLPDCDGAFDIVNVNGQEPDFYPLLIKAIEDRRLCETIKFVNTSTVGEQHGQGELKPDISAFDIDDMPRLRRIDNAKAKRQYERYEANLGLSETFAEEKVKIDPFCDDSGSYFLGWLNHPFGSTPYLDKQNDCGQVVCYAVEQCSRQHRAFLFSIMIIGSRARLFRFDRAGILITRSFDYKERPRLLCEFLWRFDHATPAQRGYDPTVTVASKTEERLFKSNIAKEVAFQLGIDSDKQSDVLKIAMKRHYEPGKVTKVRVFNDLGDSSEWIDCLVSVPVASPRSVNGRCTRGYWAVISMGPRRGKVVFLKDIWRIDVSTVEIEGEVYDEMMETEVENISNKLYGGDVYDEELNADTIAAGNGTVQASLSQDFVRAEWVNKHLKYNAYKKADDLHTRVFKHTHYRLVLEDVGYPLSEFTGSRELFEAIRDAVNALVSAYKKCNRLHRDVSIGNIILVRCRETERRKGILIDWEFSVKAARDGGSTDYIRSGTWAFMSYKALRSPSGYRHTLDLDLESALYVAIFASVQFLKHTFELGLGRWIYNFFDHSFWKLGQFIGGDQKKSYAEEEDMFVREFQFHNHDVHEFFSRMYADLRTMTFERLGTDIQSEWTADNVVKHLDDVCHALARTPSAEHDRTKNDTSDYYVDVPRPLKATHMSNRVSGVPGSDVIPNMSAGGPISDPTRRGSKRTLPNDVLTADDDNGAAIDTKRTRIEGLDSGGISIASSSCAPPRLSTLTLEERTSRRRSHARVYGSRASHRMSRHSSRSSQRKLLRKDSSLSSKSSKSGSWRPRKPRSDTSRTSG